MKFTVQICKNATITTTQLDKLTKERESQFRLMIWMKAKQMQVNGTNLKLA